MNDVRHKTLAHAQWPGKLFQSTFEYKNMLSTGMWWEQSTVPVDPKVKVEIADHFNARGMRRVYGRGDQYRNWTLNLDLWRNREGRLFARFWSRSNEVDWESWEVTGLEQADFPFGDERWVPWCLRKRYGSWVTTNT